MRYEVEIVIPYYVKNGEDYDRKTVTQRFAFYDWDEVQSFIGYMADGSEGKWVRLEIRGIKEEENNG